MSNEYTFFTLKKEHIALISNLNVNMLLNFCDEFTEDSNSPFMDGVRLIDSLKIIVIGKELTDDEKKEKDAKNEPYWDFKRDKDKLLEIFFELETALNVVFSTTSFEPGVYKKHYADIKWVKHDKDKWKIAK